MTSLWITLGITIVVLLFLIIQFKSQYLFIITITDGTPSVTKGKVDEQFLTDVTHICKLFGVTEGIIKAVPGRKGPNIICTGPIKSQQRAIINALNHPL